jgi:large subunit ribosomal protein L38
MQTDWIKTVGPHQICKIAQHYGIYQHLFGDAFFKPRVNLDIKV